MSTKKLLGKNGHREASARRSQAVREVLRMRNAFAEGSAGRYRVESLAGALESVRKDPRFTSEQKDEKFRSLLNRAR